MSESLRIALPTSSFLPSLGGAEVGLHNIAVRLQQQGHWPTVIAPAPHVKQLRTLGWELPYPVLAFPPKIWGVLRHWPALGLRLFDTVFERLQCRHGFDFWHVTMGYPTGVAFAWHAVRRGGRPHLIRCAGEDIQRHEGIGYGARLRPSVDQLLRTWLPRADRLVAITASVAEEYRTLGIAPDRVVEIPNGVDLERFSDARLRNSCRAALGVKDETCVFLAVGRNHPKKNYMGLLDAAARLSAQGGVDFHLVIAGGGVGELAGAVRAHGLEGRVLLREQIGPASGHVPSLPADELVALYQAADVFVFPSLMETFGIVLVEAMAAGLPVITTDAPGCRDVVRGGQDAVSVVAGDVDALAEGMGRLLGDAGLRADLAGRSLRRAQYFSWDIVVERYLECYRSVLDSHREAA